MARWSTKISYKYNRENMKGRKQILRVGKQCKSDIAYTMIAYGIPIIL